VFTIIEEPLETVDFFVIKPLFCRITDAGELILSRGEQSIQMAGVVSITPFCYRFLSEKKWIPDHCKSQEPSCEQGHLPVTLA
jgi:hypothetical protein